MTDIVAPLKRNRDWAASMRASDPDFFNSLAHQQSPEGLLRDLGRTRKGPSREGPK